MYFQSLPIGVVGSDGSIKLVEAVVASWSILYVEVVNLQRAMWQCPFLPFIKVGFDVCADLGLVQRGTFEAKIGKVKVLYVYISVATNNLLANQRKLGYGIEFCVGVVTVYVELGGSWCVVCFDFYVAEFIIVPRKRRCL